MLNKLDILRALTLPRPPLDFVLPGLLAGSFGLLVAPGATGKSQLALDVAISLALGRPVADGLFPACPPSKVVYLAAEECEGLLAERLRPLIDLDEQSNPKLRDNLILLPMAGEACGLVADNRPTALYQALREISADARLIIVDPLRRLHGGDENSSADMTQFVVLMEQLARATGAAVLGLHHANRASAGDGGSQHAARGSSALVDGARWQLNLSRMDEKTADQNRLSDAERALYVALDFAKTNYLPPQPRCWLKRGNGGRFSPVRLPTTAAKARTAGGARLLNMTH
ncbi:helicase RepA family protein [Burkholderia gladioli]|uniref:helicase RepA family protein n=1 Tax=Burkholderia gladioli TaxID=28095 RepID=UPI00163DFA3A|nr:helicase RepA family protein [Burkholderia gladioli]MBU9218211.1 helicase RepA family protein [Burkholderia gladioli]MDN7725349.1 helicase RepA family protein [Burkholderia gladioli]